ncbi:antiviral reverse transcriptase Drt3a [Curtobacterium oceanosedimentum]|uniref:antiviral reverse transcriptase Drt3a n=1 Tax=Curtobacterium oceanosedimentum TaxID=465820 RepID=UPI0009E720B2|nr:antiviral reverse transcriptase Drt3a [Curtobacterium oceanosedimentum]
MSSWGDASQYGVLTPTELRRIWDAETRKGKDLLKLAPKPVVEAYAALRLARRSEDERRLAEAKQEWEAKLTAFLVSVSSELRSTISSDTFQWQLAEGRQFKGKSTFQPAGTAAVYLLERVLVQQLNALIPGKTSSDRSSAVQQVATSIVDRLPKSVYRSDIRSFYESIPLENLLPRIEAERKIPAEMRSLIRSFLEEYRDIKGDFGVPRGTALGAALAEFYLSPLDVFLRQQDTLLHVRYVDDIVVVVGEIDPSRREAGDDIEALLETELAALGLEVNKDKARRYDIREGAWSGVIEYLGYSITPGSHSAKVLIGPKRMAKLHRRIERAFEVFQASGEESILVDRLRMLTGNTRLRFNKQQAMVGIYFSNRDCSDSRQLQTLDHHLEARLKGVAVSARAREVISAMSFVKGFEERRFHKFSTKRLRQMKGAWDA